LVKRINPALYQKLALTAQRGSGETVGTSVWVIRGHSAIWPRTTAIGAYADGIGGKTHTDLRKSVFKAKADVLAMLSERLQPATSGLPARRWHVTSNHRNRYKTGIQAT